ncbi:uncharacterized protein LOC129320472 [Prosopis cineraria]|uniref:uncharacterized protein LOC129320472 n=1 Tax=Prosopis cineraria TaxID=364024 RepID=UPI00240ECD93|nr:uncharacterized protein LOC129320472 [Prosopis cineraria]
MATRTERSSKPLHNFSFPCLKWGNQRFLRCVKVSPKAAEPSSFDRGSSRSLSNSGNSLHRQINRRPSNPKRNSNSWEDAEINIEAVREKLMIDLRVAAKKLKVSILEEGAVEDETAAIARPWNLRTRRAACKAPHEEERKCNSSSLPTKVVEAAVTKENPVSVAKNEKTKFSVSLSKEDVEEDFLAMVGTRPPRRPKKRPRIVQRQLDTLFPGLWLTEVTAESYKVPDVPE